MAARCSRRKQMFYVLINKICSVGYTTRCRSIRFTRVMKHLQGIACLMRLQLVEKEIEKKKKKLAT